MAAVDFNNTSADGTVIELENYTYQYDQARNRWDTFSTAEAPSYYDIIIDTTQNGGLDLWTEVLTDRPGERLAWDLDATVRLIVTENGWLHGGLTVDNSGTFPNGVVIDNSGIITGTSSGDAINITSTDTVTVNNNAGAIIAGGGGVSAGNDVIDTRGTARNEGAASGAGAANAGVAGADGSNTYTIFLAGPAGTGFCTDGPHTGGTAGFGGRQGATDGQGGLIGQAFSCTSNTNFALSWPAGWQDHYASGGQGGSIVEFPINVTQDSGGWGEAGTGGAAGFAVNGTYTQGIWAGDVYGLA